MNETKIRKALNELMRLNVILPEESLRLFREYRAKKREDESEVKKRLKKRD